jgi:hypothetical protein
MSEMSHTFSKSMFLATAEREFVLQRWHYFASICLILFISWFSSPDSLIILYFFPFLIVNFARSLQPVMAFESSVYRMLMPHAKQYAFYHAILSVLILSFTASLMIFDSLPSRILSFSSLVLGATTFALLTREKKARTLGRTLIFSTFLIAILAEKFFDQSITEAALHHGQWMYQHYLVVAIGLNVMILGLFWRFYVFTNTKFEYNPELYEDSLYRDKYFRELQETKNSEEHLSSDTIKSKWQMALSQCFNFLMPKTELRKLLYADIDAKTLSSFGVLVLCSLLLSAYIVYSHFRPNEMHFDAFPIILALGMSVFMTLNDELANKKQLIVYLWLATPAKNRASYMKQLANVFIMRQTGILLALVTPVAVPHLLFSSSISDRLFVTQFLFWSFSSFFYFMAYNFWFMSNSNNDISPTLGGVVAVFFLTFSWLAISHDEINITGLFIIVGVSLLLWILSLRRWKRHALEWV